MVNKAVFCGHSNLFGKSSAKVNLLKSVSYRDPIIIVIKYCTLIEFCGEIIRSCKHFIMTTKNYMNEAKPHETAYFYHLSNITTNLAEFRERSAETYATREKQKIDAFCVPFELRQSLL